MPAARTPLNFEPDPRRQRQARIANGCNVPTVGQVLRLHINPQPVHKLVASSQVQFGVSIVQIAVRQQQAVAAIEIVKGQEVRIVRPAGKG